MMQHQTVVKRVNGVHESAHRPYQLLISASCTNMGRKMKGNLPRAADQCPFRHSQVRLPLSWLCQWYDLIPVELITLLYLAATRVCTPGDTAKPRYLICGTSLCS